MKFSNWLEVTEKMPVSIAALSHKPLDDMSSAEVILLAKWHGIEPIADIGTLREKIRNKRSARKGEDPSVEEVRDRVRKVLMRQGQQGGKWLPRRVRA
jgi:hypothetical protein